MKKLKNILKESNVQIGKVYSNPYATAFVKETEQRKMNNVNLSEEQKQAFLEAVKQYKKYGEAVYRNAGLGEVYESIKNVVNVAEKLTLSETEDWFDNITVNRHMKRMGESFKVFERTLKEVSTLQQRLEASYDEIGEVLGKYYEINEGNTLREKNYPSFADPLEGFPKEYKELLKKLQRSNDGNERKKLIDKMNVIRKNIKLNALSNEGNEFGAERAKAIANGDDSFEVDGKKYPVKDVDKDDKENAKEFTKESMKLTDMIKKPSVNEATKPIGKAIFSNAKGKLFFGYKNDDDTVKLVDYKTWKKLPIKDLSNEFLANRVINSIVRNEKQFNKKVEYNTWSKKTNPSFEDRMDYFIKNNWISNITKAGIKEAVESSVNEAKRGKKVTKKMWDKMNSDEREEVLLTFFKDPDDVQDYIDSKWNDLPNGAANGLFIFDSVNEAKYDIGMVRKGNGITVYNRAEEERGDYKNIAHISDNGTVKYYDKNIPNDVKKKIEAEAQKMKESVNEEIKVGSMVTIDYPTLKKPIKSKVVRVLNDKNGLLYVMKDGSVWDAKYISTNESVNESKSMKLTSMIKESFGIGELPSSKLMKMNMSLGEIMNEGVSVSSLLKDVIKGSTSRVNGVKVSKVQAQQLLNLYDTMDLRNKNLFDKAPTKRLLNMLNSIGESKMNEVSPYGNDVGDSKAGFSVGDSVTIAPKAGYWDVTQYPYGGDFKRIPSGQNVSGKVVSGTVKIPAREVRVDINVNGKSRTIVIDKKFLIGESTIKKIKFAAPFKIQESSTQKISGINFEIRRSPVGLMFKFKNPSEFRKSNINVNDLVNTITKMLDSKFGKGSYTFLQSGGFQDDPTINGLEFGVNISKLF